MPAGIRSPTQSLLGGGGGEVPGSMMHRRSQQSAMEKVNMELGKYFIQLGNEMVKGPEADPTAMARAKGAIRELDRVMREGSGPVQQPGTNMTPRTGVPGPRPGRGVDPITNRPIGGSNPSQFGAPL